MVNNMKKNIVIILIFAIIIVSILGIVLYNREHGITNEIDAEIIIEISDFKSKLEENNLNIEKEETSDNPSIIGAEEGVKYTISGSSIQVYRYNLHSKDELAVSNVKKAEEEGKIILPNFDDTEIKVIYNKGLILTNYEDHPDSEKIIEIFKSL